jgi:KUP system potassium uptake protein
MDQTADATEVKEVEATRKELSARQMAGLALAATGVVFGDIGTSPLYTLKECLNPEHGVMLSTPNVLGILSLITWALISIVGIKYAVYMMRLDNRGEGGVLALLALVLRTKGLKQPVRWLLITIGIAGASMFFGDGMITPAISVLSAVEGLEIATPAFKPYVLPVTVVILIALFLIQRKGTEHVGKLFGPIISVWFICIAVLGLRSILQEPGVLLAFNPLQGLAFLFRHRGLAFLVLGSVVLAVTGAEALYADMGHFGKGPIRLSWFSFVLPALLLNYYGQGALVIRNPATIQNPFFHLVPHWALIPMVGLAAISTVIASQAVISGAFSVAQSAIQLRFLPRMQVSYTSEHAIGQVYISFINWLLLIAVLALVLAFRSSSNLASAYGIAVTGEMLSATVLSVVVIRKRMHWPLLLALLVGAYFFVIDAAFFTANTLKIPQGAWFPLVVGACVFTLMTTWRQGRTLLAKRLEEQSMPLDAFLPSIQNHPPTLVQGTAVFLTSNLDLVPQALLHNLKHNQVMHERVVFLRIMSRGIPYVNDDERVELIGLSQHVYRIQAWYGFRETPNIPALLDLCKNFGVEFDMMTTSFFLSRETVVPSPTTKGMALWREKLFAWMARNSLNAAKFFGLPMNRVIEMGGQVEI